MYNNLTFLSNPVNKALMLIHLTLWTFSVGSYIGRLNKFSAETAEKFYVLVSRDDAMIF